jgi:hypothetical protein
LFNNVIDIWAVFTPPEVGIIQGNNSQTSPTNQSDLDQQNKYIMAFNKSIGIKS